MDTNIIYEIKEYLLRKRLITENFDGGNVELRKKGKSFSDEEHLKGLIYSQMSAQTVWANIEKHLREIDSIFFQYDFDEIKRHNYQYFVSEIQKIRCGSRLTNNQMKVLKQNIETLELIIGQYGSMDQFVMSAEAPEIVKTISSSNSKYKLQQVGPALAWEYLRNVGIDGAKPDVHMKRILGKNRLGVSKYENATDIEVFQICKQLSNETGLYMTQIDYLLWSYCATGKGEICTDMPDCARCVIRKYCNKGENMQSNDDFDYDVKNEKDNFKKESLFEKLLKFFR